MKGAQCSELRGKYGNRALTGGKGCGRTNLAAEHGCQVPLLRTLEAKLVHTLLVNGVDPSLVDVDQEHEVIPV